MAQSRWSTLTLLLAALLPAIVMAIVIARLGVDVPHWDEWSLVDVFAKAHAHQLSFADLFAQNNEHRILFPKLIFVGLVSLAGWRPRLEMFASLALCTGSAFCLLWLLRRTVAVKTPALVALTLLTSALLFSPAQHENWLWGYQLAIFLLVFCMFAGAAIVSSGLGTLPKFVLAAGCALVATFSGGNGMLLWPLLLFGFLLRGEKLSAAIVVTWLLLGASAAALYLWHYEKPGSHPALAASRNFLDYIVYITAFAGSALGRTADNPSLYAPVAIGFALLALFCSLGAVVVFQWRDDERRRAAAPWLSIAAFACLSDVLACITRIGFGRTQALDSRYTSFSLPLVIALVPLSIIAGRTKLLRNVPAVIALLFLTTLPHGFAMMKNSSTRRARGQLALLFINLAPDKRVLESTILPDVATLTVLANQANALRLLQPPLLVDSDIDAMTKAALAPRSTCGALTSLTAIDERSRLTAGWARHPETHRTSDGVLLTFRDADEPRKFLAVSFERFPRPPNAQPRGGKEWRITFERDRLPASPTTIEAWAFDARRLSVCKLEGATVVE